MSRFKETSSEAELWLLRCRTDTPQSCMWHTFTFYLGYDALVHVRGCTGAGFSGGETHAQASEQNLAHLCWGARHRSASPQRAWHLVSVQWEPTGSNAVQNDGTTVFDDGCAWVDDAVGDEVGNAVGNAVYDAVGEAVGAFASAAVGGALGTVGSAVGDVVCDGVGEAVGAVVSAAVGEAVGSEVGVRVDDAVGDEVGNALGDAVCDAVGEAVGAVVSAAVGGAVGNEVGAGRWARRRPSFTQPCVGAGVSSAGVGAGVGGQLNCPAEQLPSAAPGRQITMYPVSRRHKPGDSPRSQGLEHASGFGAGVGASRSGQVGRANGLPKSIKTCIVSTSTSPLTPCSCICIILSASEKAEFKTTVTISKTAFVIIPESRPHICGVSAGNFPSHALMHLCMLSPLTSHPFSHGV